jgi:hypothetical protein
MPEARSYSWHIEALLPNYKKPLGQSCYSITLPLRKFDGLLTELTKKLTVLTVLQYVSKQRSL